MYHSQFVRFRQTAADLLGNKECFSHSNLSGLTDEAFEVLTRDILHGDVVAAFVSAQVIHAAYILVDDLAGSGQFVAEALHGFFVGRDLRFDKLERYLLVGLFVQDFIDPSHAAFSQLFNDLIASGKSGACGQLLGGGFHGLGVSRFWSLGKESSADLTESRIIWIFGLAFRAYVRQIYPHKLIDKKITGNKKKVKLKNRDTLPIYSIFLKAHISLFISAIVDIPYRYPIDGNTQMPKRGQKIPHVINDVINNKNHPPMEGLLWRLTI